MCLFLFLCSGWLYRLVSGLSKVSGATGWASAAKVRSVLWLYPSKLQPGTECGPQPHVVPQLWPWSQWLWGAHLFRWRAHEQGGGRHLVQTRWPPGCGPLFMCFTVRWRQKNVWLGIMMINVFTLTSRKGFDLRVLRKFRDRASVMVYFNSFFKCWYWHWQKK